MKNELQISNREVEIPERGIATKVHYKYLLIMTV